MRLFALQTDRNEIIKRFCHAGESVVHLTHYHWMSFVVGIFHEVLATAGLALLAGMALYLGAPILWTAVGFAVAWITFCFFGLMKAYIDWCYDFILVTTDKVILVDQTSIFRQSIKPIHVENIGSAGTMTQWWNLFDFGVLILDLKEGESSGTVIKRFVPHAGQVASAISDVVTRYQRGSFGNARQRAEARPAQAEIGRRALRRSDAAAPAAAKR